MKLYKNVMGGGKYVTHVEGGIYMESSVNNSCCAWHCKVVGNEETGQDMIDFTKR